MKYNNDELNNPDLFAQAFKKFFKRVFNEPAEDVTNPPDTHLPIINISTF